MIRLISAVLLVLMIAPIPAVAADSGGAVTVSGTGAYANMKITVSQTGSLIDQVVTVTWSGGAQTQPSNGQFLRNYLTLMQCWGDDPSGPRREQCQYGGLANQDSSDSGAFVRTRQVSYGNLVDPAETYRQKPGGFDPAYVPFDSVTGTTVNTGNTNQFFDGSTTNEIPLGRTRADGTGQEFFEVQSASEAPGLGCGTVVGGKPRSCWLVAVPRGATEVDGRDPSATGHSGLISSPLSAANWANHIAVKLDFKPIGQVCPIGAKERRMLGDELLTEAVSSWQPALCANGGTVFGFSQVTDDLARRHLIGSDDPGMVLVNAAVPPDQVPASRPVVYAPIGLSGLSMAFFIERHADQQQPPDVLKTDGQRFTELSLTPRLVAKLLTASYQTSVEGLPDYLSHNAPDLTRDPDFIALNPSFTNYNYGVYIADALVSVDTADADVLLWNWVFADKDARDFMNGSPDKWGMTVNPDYKGMAPPVNNFPKSDLSCNKPLPPYTPICTLDSHPYTNDMHAAAQAASRGNTLAKGHYDALFPGLLQNAPRQLAGQRALLAVVDTATAQRYSLPTAKLRNSAGNFVAPTAESMLATQAEMRPGTVGDVLVPNPTATAANAYPLTSVSYAATAPAALDAASGTDFAAFIRYAAGLGQQPGIATGQLPPGYVPLPDSLRAQAVTAAQRIADLAGKPVSSATSPGRIGVVGVAGRETLPAGPGAASVPVATATAAPSAAPPPEAAKPGDAKPSSTVQPIASVVRTPGSPVGLIRYALAAVLGLGVLAAVAAAVLNRLGAARKEPDQR